MPAARNLAQTSACSADGSRMAVLPHFRAARLVPAFLVMGSLAGACSGFPPEFSEQAGGPVVTLTSGDAPQLTTAPPESVLQQDISKPPAELPFDETAEEAVARLSVKPTELTPPTPEEIQARQVADAIATMATWTLPGPQADPSPKVAPAGAIPEALLIGDSVLKNLEIASTPFPFPVAYDTSVSRSIVKIPEIMAAQRELGPLPEFIVIHLGTNGWADSYVSVFEAELIALADYKVILVNVYADRVWQAPANTQISAMAERHAHVSLVDWHSSVTPAMLRSDLVHPSEYGRLALSWLIRDEVLHRAMAG